MTENRSEITPLPIPSPEDVDVSVAAGTETPNTVPEARVGHLVSGRSRRSKRGGRVDVKPTAELAVKEGDEDDFERSESPEDSASVYSIGGGTQPEIVPTPVSFYEQEIKNRLEGERMALVAAREETRKAGVKAGDIAKIERLYKEELVRQEQEWKKIHSEDSFEPKTFDIRYGVIDKYLKGSRNENFISLQRGRFWTDKGRNEAAVALQDYFEKQEAYDNAKKSLAKELWEQKIGAARVEEASDFAFDKNAFLKTARVELFTSLLLDERGELERLAHEQLPPQEKKLWQSALDTWRSIPLAGRLAITTAIATGVVFAATPSVGAVGLASYAGSRLVRGITASFLSNVTSKFVGSFVDFQTEKYHRENLENFSSFLAEDEIGEFNDFLDHKQAHINTLFEDYAHNKSVGIAAKILTGLVSGSIATYQLSSAQHSLEHAFKPVDTYIGNRFGTSGVRSSAVDYAPTPKAGGVSELAVTKPITPESVPQPASTESTPTPAAPGQVEPGVKTPTEAPNASPAAPTVAKEVFTAPKVLKELEGVEKNAPVLKDYLLNLRGALDMQDVEELHELATVGKGGSAWKAVYGQLEYMVKNKLVDPRDLGIKLSNLDVGNSVKLRHALDARVLEILKEDGYLRDGVDVRIARPGVPLDLKIGTDARGGVHVFINQPEVPVGQKPVFYNYEENRTSAPTPAHEIPKTRFAVVPQNDTIPLDETPRASASSLVQRAPLDPEFGKHPVPISKADIDVVRNSSEALSGELNKNRIFSSLPDSAPSLSPRVMLEVIHAQPSQAQAVDMFLSRLKFDDRFVESKWPLFEHMSVGEFSTHINSLQLLREAERSTLFGGRATPVAFRLDLRTDFIGRSASIEIPADTRMYLLADFMATQKNLIEASANVRGQSLAQFLLNRATR